MLTYLHTKCLKCVYDLYGSTSPVCPECGTHKFKLPRSKPQAEPYLRRLFTVDSRVRTDTVPIAGFLVTAFTAAFAAIAWLALSGIRLGDVEDLVSTADRSSAVLVSMFVIAAGTFGATLVVWFGTIWTMMGVWEAWGKAERQWQRQEMMERNRSEK